MFKNFIGPSAAKFTHISARNAVYNSHFVTEVLKWVHPSIHPSTHPSPAELTILTHSAEIPKLPSLIPTQHFLGILEHPGDNLSSERWIRAQAVTCQNQVPRDSPVTLRGELAFLTSGLRLAAEGSHCSFTGIIISRWGMFLWMPEFRNTNKSAQFPINILFILCFWICLSHVKTFLCREAYRILVSHWMFLDF